MATTFSSERLDDKQVREAESTDTGPAQSDAGAKPGRNGRKARQQTTPPERPQGEVVPTAEPSASSPAEQTPDPTPSPLPTTLTPMGIVDLAIEAQTRFFQDQHGDVFSWISTVGEGQHFECLRLRSRAFRARLLDLIREETGSVPNPSELKQAIEILELRAYDSQRIELANRRRGNSDAAFIDLGDPEWKMITVTPKGWEIGQHPGPLFYRTKHQLPLGEPISGGDPEELFEFVPVDTDQDKLIILTWVTAGFCPAIPNPILLFVGQQGSAKTTRSRRLRSLLDPSVTPVLGDIEMSDLFLTFQHHAVPCFENVSRFSRREADMFCRAVTGNGVDRRQLYTDSEQKLYSFRRPIIINGLDTPSLRPDFLDRCMIINCRRMEKFMTLQKLDQAFDAARPRLLGTMLDLLVKTLSLLGGTSASSEFRMADFAHFGRAVAKALGKTSRDFDKAYRHNIRQQDCEVLEDSPMVRAVEKFAEKYSSDKPWKGSAAELLEKLRYTAHVLSDANVKADMPKSARWLSSRLSDLAAALATRSVAVERLPRTNSSRGWQVYYGAAPKKRTVDEELKEADIFDVLESAGDEQDKAPGASE